MKLDMKVKLLKQSGQAAVVSYWDSDAGMAQAKVISVKSLPKGTRNGQQVVITMDVLDQGTDYGIEWGLLLDYTDVMRLYTKALRSRGVWTIEDLLHNPAKVIAAFTAASAAVYALLRKAAQEL